VLLRPAYLAVTNAFAALRLLPIGNRDKDAEILALRHKITVLERQLGDRGLRFAPPDWAILAALLHPLPRNVLRRLQLTVHPDTVLRWHRGLLRGRRTAESLGVLHLAGTPTQQRRRRETPLIPRRPNRNRDRSI
jgi:hypothetical protein